MSLSFFQHFIAKNQKHEQQTGEDNHGGLNRFCVKKLELQNRSLGASHRILVGKRTL